MTEALAPLSPHEWESYYVIVGSSAGALTGLQFVVMTLIADTPAVSSSEESISAFGTPNVVHFCSALLVSAIFSAPWRALGPPGVATAVTGALGVLYALMVMRRAVRQHTYQPVFEDWLWHGILPLVAYGALLHAGIAIMHASGDALYIAGAAALLLVFVGIHNAWDTVMYMTALEGKRKAAERAAPTAATPEPHVESPSSKPAAPPSR